MFQRQTVGLEGKHAGKKPIGYWYRINKLHTFEQSAISNFDSQQVGKKQNLGLVTIWRRVLLYEGAVRTQLAGPKIKR